MARRYVMPSLGAAACAAIVAIPVLAPVAAPAALRVSAVEIEGKHRLLALDGRVVKWGAPQLGTGAVVTYALAKSQHFDTANTNCGALDRFGHLAAKSRIAPALVERELAAAFAAWASVADIRFRKIEDEAAAEIVIGTQVVPRGRAFANVSPRRDQGAAGVNIIKGMESTGKRTAAEQTGLSQPIATIKKSLICFNADQRWKVGFDGNLRVYDLRHTFTHEIGHAIGLDHPGDRMQLMDFRYSEKFHGLRAGDAVGAIRIYGRRPAP